MKRLLIQLNIILLLMISPILANANEEMNVRNFVQTNIDKILNIVSDGTMNDNKKSSLLEKTFLDVVDVGWIAKFTLGRHWKTLSSKQSTEFITLYKRYLVNIYVPNFKNYDSDRVIIDGIQEIGSHNTKEYLIKTTIVNERKTTSYSINYRIINKSGKFLIFDIITEGVSMISTQRAEFNAIISAHGIEYLFDKLRKNEVTE